MKKSRCGSFSGGRWLGFTCLGTVVFTTVYLIGTIILQWDASTHDSLQGRKILNNILIQRKQNEEVLFEHDPRLLSYIRSSGILKKPSQGPYNLIEPDIDPILDHGHFIRRLFNDKRDGFFVECRAFDGYTRSNTLTLEKDLGWNGLLIEEDSKNFDLLVAKNRKAWTAKTCLATNQADFLKNFNLRKILNTTRHLKKSPGTTPTQCLPLSTLLASLNISVVDFLSLQVQGNELSVLTSLPFNYLTIKTLLVEFIHQPQGQSELKDIMKSKGYFNIKTSTNPHDLANDLIFLHSDYEVLLDNLNA